jgi:hypothetical protein
MNRFVKLYFYASLTATMVSLSTAHAVGYSDNIGGQKLSGYTVGANFFGSEDVAVFPPAGEPFTDPANCAGSTSPSAVLPNTADTTYRLLLVQVMSAAATGQKLTLLLGDSCYDIGYGVKRPVIIGLRAYTD